MIRGLCFDFRNWVLDWHVFRRAFDKPHSCIAIKKSFIFNHNMWVVKDGLDGATVGQRWSSELP